MCRVEFKALFAHGGIQLELRTKFFRPLENRSEAFKSILSWKYLKKDIHWR